MQTNHFLPPTSPSPSEEREPKITPVFIGLLMGAGSAYLLMSLTGQVCFWWLALTGTPIADLYRRAYDSMPFMVVEHTMGFACMATGGYWAARMSAGRSSSVALVAGAIFTVFTVVQYITPYSLPIPFWSQALSVLLPIPGYLVGASVFRRRTSRTGA